MISSSFFAGKNLLLKLEYILNSILLYITQLCHFYPKKKISQILHWKLEVRSYFVPLNFLNLKQRDSL